MKLKMGKMLYIDISRGGMEIIIKKEHPPPNVFLRRKYADTKIQIKKNKQRERDRPTKNSIIAY